MKLTDQMPVIKIQSISTFSSEDVNYPARNLLSSDTYRKWKCASAGEKQAIVVFQLETPAQIHGLDIGNEGSAFVEVLVERSTMADDYKVLLVASSFMSPADSKAWKNTNRVRMFGPDKLSKAVADQKWDRIKVVCTQPYNKKEQYGLSFITLHSPPSDDPTATKTQSTTPTLGAFSLKEEPTPLPTGALFYKKESAVPSTAGSAAAQARSATAAALRSPAHHSPPQRTDVKGKRRRGAVEDRKKASGERKTTVSTTTTRNGIMSGVVFSLSGFQNPFRGELREKAVEMGATFQPDWNNSCTHLVCAFPNTPKYSQVKAKRGLIVRKEWVLDSYTKKKRLSASKYRVSGGTGGSSSEDEFYDRKERELFASRESGRDSGVVAAAVCSGGGSSEGVSAVCSGVCSGGGSSEGVSGVVAGTKRHREETEGAEVPERGAEEEEDEYGGSTEDMDTDVVKSKPPVGDLSSECDTEDEIQRIRAEQDEYAGTTETETDSDERETVTSLADLPDLFSCAHFLLYGTFSQADRRLLQRYITAYNGIIEEYMGDKVSYVVTLEGWDVNFDQALEDNSGLAFVGPQWIFKCHEKQSLVPHQPYAVIPS